VALLGRGPDQHSVADEARVRRDRGGGWVGGKPPSGRASLWSCRFCASDNTCEICRAGCQSSCIHREGIGAEGAQAERMRVPLANGTLVVGGAAVMIGTNPLGRP
jgi:hypothetical protein